MIGILFGVRGQILDETILVKFGNRVKRIRISRGISQERLADRAGLHRTYIGMIERAEKNVSLKNIEKIADALEVSISELMETM